MTEAVEESNEKHLSPWSDACNESGVVNTPLTPYIDKVLDIHFYIYASISVSMYPFYIYASISMFICPFLCINVSIPPIPLGALI